MRFHVNHFLGGEKTSYKCFMKCPAAIHLIVFFLIFLVCAERQCTKASTIHKV